MSPTPPAGGPRSSRPALVALALVLALAALPRWGQADRPPPVDAGDLAAAPQDARGAEAIVTGEWVTTAPTEKGYMVVVLRGQAGGRLVCHFEDVPTADRAGLEVRLIRSGEVAVHGRCGVENGVTTLRGCSLLD